MLTSRFLAFGIACVLFGGTALAAETGHVHAAPASPDGGFWNDFFKVYTPRRACMLYENAVIWLHVVSDALIAIAYYSIPLALVSFLRRRRDLAFSWMFWMFAAFILLCGTTHVVGVIDIWKPMYRLDGVVKAATAGISVLTAIALWPLIPRALALPSPAQLEQTVRQRTAELASANARLVEEARARAESESLRLRLAAIVESSDDAIISESLDSIITSWNRAAERLFGYTVAEALGKPITIIQPPDRRHEEGMIIDRLRRGEPVDHFETIRMHRDGRQFDVAVTASPIHDPEGRLIGVSKIARDITDRKRTEQERERMIEREQAARAEAERASRMKDEFLATLSHELRTPLTAILGWTQIVQRSLSENAGVDPKLLEGVNVIHRNARAQAQLIDDLLDTNRIVSGKLRLEVRPIRLQEVVEAAIESVQPAAAAKRVHTKTVAESPVAILADPTRLQQVVWNLLTNAVKFTPPGGNVQIRFGRADDTTARLVVSDDGVGIEPGFLPHVFERFSQFDGSTTRRYGGLGLGLAIVRHLVELHGGSITVHSDGVGRGVTATVLLPMRPPGEDASDRPQSSVTTGDLSLLDDLSVLVIDDDSDARALIKQFLLECGARPTLAGSAAEGMAILKSVRPSVVLCDIGMPEEDGYGFLRRLRALSPADGGATPAVALTAFASADDRRRALDAGFDLHVPKPIDRAELMIAVAAAAAKVRSAS